MTINNNKADKLMAGQAKGFQAVGMFPLRAFHDPPISSLNTHILQEAHLNLVGEGEGIIHNQKAVTTAACIDIHYIHLLVCHNIIKIHLVFVCV